VKLLQSTDSRWAAAANGSMTAAPLQLAGGRAVMSIGGFTGSSVSERAFSGAPAEHDFGRSRVVARPAWTVARSPGAEAPIVR
jgi:hypothetical protein